MKRLILITTLLLLAVSAHATLYILQSCNYTFMLEFSKHKWVGVYESVYGNSFVFYFDSYCPATINQ